MVYITISLLFTAATLGLLGPIILWHRLTQMGDALSHSIMFSLVIRYFFDLGQTSSTILVALIFAFLLEFGARDQRLDGGAKVVSLSCLLISSTIIISDLADGKIRIKEFLLGDAMALSYDQMKMSIVIFFLVAAFFVIYYKKIILSVTSRDFAKVMGVNVLRINLAVKIMLCLTIALAANVIGILLVSSLLVIPASMARLISKSPVQMTIISCLISSLAGVLSIFISLNYDVSYGPCLALMLSSSYVIMISYSSLLKRY
ncbi:MAG: metal ABC transporter permease [Rickettsiaceae bacterium]|nr:metal ABC transporter permease [Rickettsiaceae bacterium]